MLKCDGHRLTNQGGVESYQVCTRWEEVTESVRIIASLAEAAETPVEVRLLNNADPLTLGIHGGESDESLSILQTQLAVTPIGKTPICKQIQAVHKKIISMENELRSRKKVALLIIMTDGESTDGDIIDYLKLLVGLPVQIIVRICTDEKDVADYWQQVNAKLDLDLYVLDEMHAEATLIAQNNPWLTYGEPLHRLREFGIKLPAMDQLGNRQLSKKEIFSVANTLFEKEGDWGSMLCDVEIESCSADNPSVYSLLQKSTQPWLQNSELQAYVPDPVRLLIDSNESLLWSMYIFYAFHLRPTKNLGFSVSPPKSPVYKQNSVYTFDSGSSPILGPPKSPISPPKTQSPNKRGEMVFHSAYKFEKKLLLADNLWMMMEDFDLVPTVINTIRFKKTIQDINGTSPETGISKIKLSFRDFIKIIIKTAATAFPKEGSPERVVSFFKSLEKSSKFQKIIEVDKTLEGSSSVFHLDLKALAAEFDRMEVAEKRERERLAALVIEEARLLEEQMAAAEVIRLEEARLMAEMIAANEIIRIAQEAHAELVRLEQEKAAEVLRVAKEAAEVLRREKEAAANEIMRIKKEAEAAELYRLESIIKARKAENMRMEKEAARKLESIRLEREAEETERIAVENEMMAVELAKEKERVAVELMKQEQEALAAEVVRRLVADVIRLEEEEAVRLEVEAVAKEIYKQEVEAAETERLRLEQIEEESIFNGDNPLAGNSPKSDKNGKIEKRFSLRDTVRDAQEAQTKKSPRTILGGISRESMSSKNTDEEKVGTAKIGKIGGKNWDKLKAKKDKKEGCMIM
eukprot:CAMPEP_0119035502 /NCGR_PEP_ID=MMETSP1177-20130426/2566_1 /TAXON_ID=2985 /ORGANISM="Ochromonas sp, Strain CCMP1899" /LENGTH=804 /DNA_ID=CAMNT_0006993873 /DNA_START=237 /DNA_END=2651 /DNA_ORIENTATION=-